MKMKLLSSVQLFATPWTVAYQASPSMGFSWQGYWSGVLFPSPGHLPDPGIELNPGLPHFRQMLYPLSHQGSPSVRVGNMKGFPYMPCQPFSCPLNGHLVSSSSASSMDVLNLCIQICVCVILCL